jgi:hypothetical protein
MKLEEVLQRVETRLLGLGSRLLQAGEKADLQEELELAQAEVRSRKAEQARIASQRDEMRARIGSRKEQIAQLVEAVESSFRRGLSSQALREALELERLRRELGEDEAALPKLEQVIWSLGFSLRQMERRLDRIREQLSGR